MSLIVPHAALPNHVIEFAADWGIEAELERRYYKREEAAA